jgi:hypothetical protein
MPMAGRLMSNGPDSYLGRTDLFKIAHLSSGSNLDDKERSRGARVRVAWVENNGEFDACHHDSSRPRRRCGYGFECLCANARRPRASQLLPENRIGPGMRLRFDGAMPSGQARRCGLLRAEQPNAESLTDAGRRGSTALPRFFLISIFPVCASRRRPGTYYNSRRLRPAGMAARRFPTADCRPSVFSLRQK